MSKMKLGTAALLATSVFLTGCAQMMNGARNSSVSDDQVIERTAQHFGVSRKEIVVTDIKRSVTDVDYRTKYRGENYICYLYFDDVKCKRPGT